MGLEAVYDAQAGTFPGRTAGSWFKILGFYAIYYTLLGFLFYGSVQIGMIRIKNQEILGKTRGVDKPVIRTRTDQPGVDAWPQNMVIEDNQGMEFELATYEKKYGKEGNKYPLYVQKIEEYILNYCPFENQCALNDIFGDLTLFPFVQKSETDAVELPECDDVKIQSRKCIVFRAFCKGKETCGKIMKINHEVLKGKIADKETKQINKPYFFIAINKVIGFNIMGLENLAEMNGLNPTTGNPSPTFHNFKSSAYDLSATEMKETAFVNCYIFDVEASKGKCFPWKLNNDSKTVERDETATKNTPCDNMKSNNDYQIDALRPYIQNKNYVYSGYTSDEDNNKKAATYAKPFAMFQMRMSKDGKIANQEDKSLIRCNVVAKNIEYPYLDSEKLMGNALLSQPGHGWVQLGFRQRDAEEETN